MNFIRSCLVTLSVFVLLGCNVPTSVIDTNTRNLFDQQSYLTHVKTLASDEFGGRAPATPGGELTVSYLEDNFKALGLEPAFGSDGFRQPVSLMVISTDENTSLELTTSSAVKTTLAYKDEMIAWTRRPVAQASISDSELVFVGYGVVAPEYNWNDYAGLDMQGKTAVILVNDPGYLSGDENFFNGKAMTYYGRWTYKFEEAARQGAAGAIVIHQTGAAGYPWGVVSGSWSGPQYHLLDAGDVPLAQVEGWITEASAKNLFANAGLDFATLAEQAGKPGFNPRSLKTSASITLDNVIEQSESYNVGAILPGSKNPDEYFIYTGHWDHLGTDQSNTEGDNIYNGAVDNATGTAALLELARVFASQPQRPERSLIFLAVTAEESGLLGSAAYVENPPVPLNKTVAGINMDGMSVYGASNDVVVIGWDASDLQDYLTRAAATQDRVLVREPTPEKGFFYRSDHFNFAKKGVPMMYAEAGNDIRGKGSEWGKQQQADYTANRYHKPGDEYDDSWDVSGILQDLEMNYLLAQEILNSDDWPEWRPGNEFRKIREQSLATGP